MNHLRLLIVTLSLKLSAFVFAGEIDRNTTASMIDQMVARGIIGKHEAEQAKSKLTAMPDQEWGQLSELGRKLASQQIANGNVDLSVDSAAHNIDFNSKQFKDIQSKVKSIMQAP
ncbi:hypothetical protein M902_1095 [Bacteriovorax sp. BAL6_X]|uniref:hypothetical protein n=1 Tax=Bacteriovorax sp. BAL6_X TaxID=1201290 RepID=UPI000385CBCA|nr:hypothetical protein [Bacteriovorax sp. BAL6_X]EPZ49496.1 hypothetical protein M902_1095 [Bacteriovorax sp. BAL6_X]